MPNRLARETSPYLRQHADNPVDWFPWGEEAFALAETTDRPVLLSVGYSACHWCHVMAHESFEDHATAALMNDLFVSVKVDREERPDVDAIYMEAVQALTGHGGWPMTVFLTPDGRPFYGGTYYPKESRSGMPSFTRVLEAIDDLWRNRRDDLLGQAAELTDALRRGASISPADRLPDLDVVDASVTAISEGFDEEWGGFGRAPKFPAAMSLDLLLRAGIRTPDPTTLHVVTTSLDAMASGGIYDHLGGGFARYSVDREWLVPHFEKMLYDQALLTRVYLHAWQVTGEERYRQVVDETVGYVLGQLRQPEGGFSSAEDADSEGVEGKFYVWDLLELTDVLADSTETAAAWWGVTASGNFEGRNILNRPVRGDLLRPPIIEKARAALFERRSERVRPGLDDKVLTEWNALMLSALAEAAAATGDLRWREAAVANAQFLLANLRGEDGRWHRSWQHDGGARHAAVAHDLAALVDAFTRVGELTGTAGWIREAESVADALLDHYWDDAAGGVFTTADDAERLVTRPKDFMDNATPSANSLTAMALLRLGALTGVERYRAAAEAILRLYGRLAAKHPSAFGYLLAAIDLAATGATEVAVVGDRPDLVSAVQSGFRPNTVLAWGEPFPSPLWEARSDGLAYVCRDFSCKAPASSVDDLLAQLS